jgi:hypothetical protein
VGIAGANEGVEAAQRSVRTALLVSSRLPMEIFVAGVKVRCNRDGCATGNFLLRSTSYEAPELKAARLRKGESQERLFGSGLHE